MENQHRSISGYRDFNQEELDAINSIKELGSMVGAKIRLLEDLHERNKAYPNEAHLQISPRWLAIAKTDLQKGFMALVRSVAQPEGF